MTPRRRQGPGRAAFDHISQQLTDSLSTLSTVNASQAAIADVARGDLERAAATVHRLDDDLLAALMRVVVQLQTITRDESNSRYNEAWQRAHPPCRCLPSCRCRLNADPPCRCAPSTEGTSP